MEAKFIAVERQRSFARSMGDDDDVKGEHLFSCF
jgi:hypothetical protein